MKVVFDCFLTLLVQEELVESQAAGLFADEAVHVLGPVVVNGDGVFQGLNAGLQTEGDLGVADSVPEGETDIHIYQSHAAMTMQQNTSTLSLQSAA